jgi:acid phosphatase
MTLSVDEQKASATPDAHSTRLSAAKKELDDTEFPFDVTLNEDHHRRNVMFFPVHDELRVRRLHIPTVEQVHPDGKHMKLRMAYLFTRHGDRSPCMPQSDAEVKLWKVVLEHNLTPTESMKDFVWSNLAETFRRCTFTSLDDPDFPHDQESTFDKNPYIGQLTSIGRAQLFKFGESFREHYVNRVGFLKKSLADNSYFVTSTNMRRTLQSVEGVLLGFDPTHEPVRLHIITDPTQEPLFSHGECERINKLMKLVDLQQKGNSLFQLPQVHDLELRVAKYLDTPKVQWTALFENWNCRISHPVVGLPAGFTPQDVDIARMVATWRWNDRYGHVNVNKLACGRLLDRIGARLEAVMKQHGYSEDVISSRITSSSSSSADSSTHSGTSMRQLFVSDARRTEMTSWESKLVQPHSLYIDSGHDVTIIMLLKALHQHIDDWPPYGSFIIFELYQDERDQSFHVRTVYNNIDVHLPQEHSSVVPVRRFLEVLKPFRLDKSFQASCVHIADEAPFQYP